MTQPIGSKISPGVGSVSGIPAENPRRPSKYMTIGYLDPSGTLTLIPKPRSLEANYGGLGWNSHFRRVDLPSQGSKPQTSQIMAILEGLGLRV